MCGEVRRREKEAKIKSEWIISGGRSAFKMKTNSRREKKQKLVYSSTHHVFLGDMA